ncbi:hypothetical protein HY932_00760 [Candidatus Falkowbacteria bacterium]|nr:hypothetical protein [Candidatus Falkowbacteria bacterium]
MSTIFFHNFVQSIKTSAARKNKTILVINILSLVFNLASWLFLYFKFKQILADKSSDIVPLHYNIYLGIDLQDKWWKAFIMPFWGTIFFIFNYLLALSLFHKKSLVSYFLSAVNLFLQLTILAACIFTLLLNI